MDQRKRILRKRTDFKMEMQFRVRMEIVFRRDVTGSTRVRKRDLEHRNEHHISVRSIIRKWMRGLKEPLSRDWMSRNVVRREWGLSPPSSPL